MSPANRGPKDGVSGRSARPPSTGTDPDQAQGRSKGPAPGPSTQTVPPEERPGARRRKRPAGGTSDPSSEGARPRRRKSTQPLSASDKASKPDDEDVAEDAWADYEEDANDWALTDEHSIAGIKPPSSAATSQAPASTTGVQVADSPLAAAPFDPQQHAVPRGPSYNPAVDLGSWQGITGQDAGQRWPITATMLAAGRIRLGRGVDNDVVLYDPSISRAHAELQRTGDMWHIVDMQSGNGTFVAGQRVATSAFVPGATLGLGSGTYRLMLPGTQVQPDAPVGAELQHAASQDHSQNLRGSTSQGALPPGNATWVLPKAVTEGPGWMRYTLLSAGLVVALGAAMGGWHMLRVYDVVGPLHTAMFEHYLDGVDALNAHRWSDAEDAFHAVMEADPNSIRGKRYLAAAIAGRADEAKLAQAQAALDARDWPKAYALAQALEQSLFHDPSRIITQQIAGHVSTRVIEAQAALEAGEIKKAQGLLGEADAIMPNRPDVALLKTRADSSLGLAYGSTPPPTGPVTLHVAPRRSKRRIAVAPANLNGPLGPAISDFNDGNADEALQKLDAAKGSNAQAMGQQLRAFLKAYNLGLSEHRNKRAFAAVQALNQAKTLEAKIGGGQGKLAGLIDAKLADMYYVMGMQAYAGGQLGEANAAFRQALEHAPEHALSKSKLDELEQKATAMIEEAEGLRGQDTEKAKSLLRDALQMVAPGSPTALKAQRAAASLR